MHGGVAVPDHGGEPGLLGGEVERLRGVVAAGRLKTDLRTTMTGCAFIKEKDSFFCILLRLHSGFGPNMGHFDNFDKIKLCKEAKDFFYCVDFVIFIPI